MNNFNQPQTQYGYQLNYEKNTVEPNKTNLILKLFLIFLVMCIILLTGVLFILFFKPKEKIIIFGSNVCDISFLTNDYSTFTKTINLEKTLEIPAGTQRKELSGIIEKLCLYNDKSPQHDLRRNNIQMGLLSKPDANYMESGKNELISQGKLLQTRDLKISGYNAKSYEIGLDNNSVETVLIINNQIIISVMSPLNLDTANKISLSILPSPK